MENESQSAPNTGSVAQMGITRFTSNFILIGMFLVWAYLSVREQMFFPISDNFVWVAGILASGDVINSVKGFIKK